MIVKQKRWANRQVTEYGHSGPVSKSTVRFCHRDLRKSAENGPDHDRSGLSICGRCGNWRAVVKKQQSADQPATWQEASEADRNLVATGVTFQWTQGQKTAIHSVRAMWRNHSDVKRGTQVIQTKVHVERPGNVH